MAELSDLVEQGSGRRSAIPDTAVFSSRTQEVVDWSRQLCRTAAKRIQEAAAIRQQSQEEISAARPLSEYRPALPRTHFTEHALWHGD